MTERRACDVIRVKERIFVRSFVKPKNIRLLGFDIRFTTSVRTCVLLEFDSDRVLFAYSLPVCVQNVCTYIAVSLEGASSHWPAAP